MAGRMGLGVVFHFALNALVNVELSYSFSLAMDAKKTIAETSRLLFFFSLH